jgi:hypothetical protein
MVELIIKRKKYSCKKCEGTAEEGIKPTVIACTTVSYPRWNCNILSALTDLCQ